MAGYWIGGLIIDRRHQRRGYGRAAVLELLERAALAGHREAASYDPQNRGARSLYANLGFVATGAGAPACGWRLQQVILDVEDRVQVEARGRLGGGSCVKSVPADVAGVGLNVGRAVAAGGRVRDAAGGPGREAALAAAGQGGLGTAGAGVGPGVDGR